MKLNELFENGNVKCFGFPAFRALETLNTKDVDFSAYLSTEIPVLMAARGINIYYAPVIPRGSVYKTCDDIYAADLSVSKVSVQYVDDITSDDRVLICSRHVGTIDILKSMYPHHIIMTDNVTAADVFDKDVVGTLPPQLIEHCKRFKAVTITDFDYNVDGDLTGQELSDRMQINKSISVDII